MKKLSIIVILALVCVLCFAGCGEEPTSTLDLSECEIGYEFEVYPNVEFNYTISDDFIVHISDIKVTLIEKNEINANDNIEGYFYPYIIKVEVKGKTDAKHANTDIYIALSTANVGINCRATISEDGTFYGHQEISIIKSFNKIYFSRISVVK